MTEPLIFVMGNCQAHALAAALAASGAGTVCILHGVHGFRPSCWGVEPFIIPLEDAAMTAQRFESYGRPVLLVEQTSPLVKPSPVDFLPNAARIRFPHVQLQSWWQKSDGDFSAERLRRFWNLDLAAMRRSETAAGLNDELSTHIEETASSRQIFSMPVHPDVEVMRRIYGIVCEGLRQFGDFGAESAKETMPDMLDFYSEHPLRPEVVQGLGLQWAETAWYQNWSAAVEAHKREDFTSSAAMHEDLLQQPGIDRHVWGTYAAVLLDCGRREDAHRAFGVAHRAFPHNAYYAWNWAQTLSPTPVSKEAEPFIDMIADIYEPFRTG